MSFFDSLRNIFSERSSDLSDGEKERLLKNFTQIEFTQEDADKFERMKSQLTAFDYQVGILCHKTFNDNSDKSIYEGMFRIMKCGLSGGFDSRFNAEKLLDEKRNRNDRDSYLIDQTKTVAAKMVNDESYLYGKFTGESNILTLTKMTIEIFEVVHPRPQFTGYLMGHYANMADFVFAIGLQILLLSPEIAEELINDPV